MASEPPTPSASSPLDDLMAASEQPYEARRRPKKRVKRRKTTVTGVLGEILITGGVLVLGFIIWQPVWSATVVAGKQREASQTVSSQWREEAATQAPAYDGEIPIPAPVAAGQPMGVLYVPAFGENFQSTIGETTDLPTVLNVPDLGTGRYEKTQQPGELGNFAMAGHRSGWAPTPFREIMNFRVGDPIFVETPAGWYTYRFRALEYVLPTQSDVLNPFPRLEGVEVTDRLLTMTTCHPKLAGSEERVISYAVFDSFQPLSDGPPQELMDLNPNVKG